MKSIITEEIIRRIGMRLSRAVNRKEKLPKHLTTPKIVHDNASTQHDSIASHNIITSLDTGDFAFVGNHEPEFIVD